jgi:hypothetical protein
MNRIAVISLFALQVFIVLTIAYVMGGPISTAPGGGSAVWFATKSVLAPEDFVMVNGPGN